MISPNHGSSDFENPEDCSRLADLESRLRLLPLRDASSNLDGRLASLFASSHSSHSTPNEVNIDHAKLAVSTSNGNARRGMVLTATCLSSIVVALTFAVVTSFSTPEGSMNATSPLRVSEGDLVQGRDSKASSILTPGITESSQSDSSMAALLAVGSQIVESEREFARSLAVVWEQQNGTTFQAMDHVRDLRFSECRRCHRRLSSSWHNEASFQPEGSVCLNCHQVGG